jgi:hypothetical protein
VPLDPACKVGLARHGPVKGGRSMMEDCKKNIPIRKEKRGAASMNNETTPLIF